MVEPFCKNCQAFSRNYFRTDAPSQFFDDIWFYRLYRSTTNVSHQTETSQLICHANQLTGFYMVENIGC